jgi:hypothetical protein
MSSRCIAWALVAAGIVIGLLSLLADTLGLGQGRGFGSAQLVGLVAGALLLIAGIVARRRATASRPAPPQEQQV